jgi:hypothetical protein
MSSQLKSVMGFILDYAIVKNSCKFFIYSIKLIKIKFILQIILCITFTFYCPYKLFFSQSLAVRARCWVGSRQVKVKSSHVPEQLVDLSWLTREDGAKQSRFCLLPSRNMMPWLFCRTSINHTETQVRIIMNYCLRLFILKKMSYGWPKHCVKTFLRLWKFGRM